MAQSGIVAFCIALVAAGCTLAQGSDPRPDAPDAGMRCRSLDYVDTQRLSGGPMAVGDVDHDGYDDLITGTLFRGGPQGLVGTEMSPQDVGPTEHIALVDVSNDGALDLIALHRTQPDSPPSDEVFVLGGVGDGTFASGIAFPVGELPSSMAFADVNADGYVDIVTTNQTSDHGVSVLMNDGAGSFAAQRPFVTSDSPTHVTIGDVNGDGVVDLLVDDNGGVELLKGFGNGDFGSAVSKVHAGGLSTLADVDEDGALDLILANRNASRDGIAIYSNDGHGLFSSTPTTYAAPAGTSVVAVVDVDRDGHLDLVVFGRDLLQSAMSTMEVALGDGTGRFTYKETRLLTDDPRTAVWGDFDGNGLVDFAVPGVTFMATCADQ